MLLTVSIVAIIFINVLSAKTENLLTANYNTIRYCSEMFDALDNIKTDTSAISRFETNLKAQENNITEKGEAGATQVLRDYFDDLKKGKRDDSLLLRINAAIYHISLLNQKALERKNISALNTASHARVWLTVLATLLVLVGLTLAMNFPGYIANPVRLLTEGIKEVARKNYDKRIYLDNKDEFGEMADAFNQMASQLYQYEHSNISKLMFEKKRVETIINQLEDAVIGLDAENKVLFINHNAEGLFCLRETEITGKYAPDIAMHNDLLRTVLQKGGNQPLKIIVDGKEAYFVVDYRMVYNEEVSIGEVITLRNITSFKELDISKTNLLATISHELKTPISSIKMSTKLIKDSRIGTLNNDQNELITNINEDADRLLKITSELLNITQIESGNIQLKLQRVSPKDIVQEAIKATQVQAEQKQIKLEVHIPDDIIPVMADADKAAWVLINFLTNAIKYSAENSTILLSVNTTGKIVSFYVRDFGMGIDEKYLSRIFDRYFKVPGNSDNTSTGLGLAISKEFIDGQGGKVFVTSELGKGSTFGFSLPA